MADDEEIVQTNKKTEINQEMKRAYLDYAMSVIVSRALPDVKDGLKPVHRRILYAMYKTGLTSGGRYSKSAKVVGEVLGKYHPHGDAPVYESLVRMAQDFSMRYLLIKGQGNFGSIDGDRAAAMRYTEVKLTKLSEEILQDLEKDTVDFVDNFDGSLQEPVFLPAKVPNLLLMGAEGIAVGMATKIPPHNITELIDALCYAIENTKKNEDKKTKKEKIDISDIYFDITLDGLLEHVKGPDFPTSGIIYGAADIRQAYETGRGKILVRGRIEDEDLGKGKTAIIIKELPYQVNKATLVEKIANLVINKKIVGVSDLRDESSDRGGIRVVIELKRDAAYKKVVNNLYKFTDLQTTFPVNTVALVDGIPQTLSLKSIIELYLKHRINVVTRRSEFELDQAKKRAHILEGFLIALDNIDAVIETIKKSQDETEAKKKLVAKFKLTEIQAQAILDMQLKRLTGLERAKIEEELAGLKKTIEYLETLLQDVFKILKVIKDEIIDLRKRFGDSRKTRVIKYKPGEITDEELIENIEVIVVLTKEGYIKQIPKGTFKTQHRGGKGVSGMQTKEEDNVSFITSAMSHDFVLFFTNQGRVFQNRIWEIPQGSRISKGKAIVNLLTLRPSEKVTSVLTYHSDVTKEDNLNVLMATKCGIVKKTSFSNFSNIRNNGIIAIKLDQKDELLWVKMTDGNMFTILTAKNGKAIIFNEKEIRPTGRSSRGVKGIAIEKEDSIVAADAFSKKEFNKDFFVISNKGIGKKTKLSMFKGQHRAGKGVKVASLDDKFGSVAFSQIINPSQNTAIITSKFGQTVKIPLTSIPSRSRSAKGVILIRLSKAEDRVAAATLI